MSGVTASLQRIGCGLLPRRSKIDFAGSGMREAGCGKRGGAAQTGECCCDLFARHSEQLVSVDQGIEVERVQVSSRRVGKAGNVARCDGLSDPARKTPTVFVAADFTA